MSSVHVLKTDRSEEWMELLTQAFQHDVYHQPYYHRLAERVDEGTACLFAYRQEGHTLMLPLLLRPLDTAPGLNGTRPGWQDATSVYGFVGPIASHATLPESVVRGFQGGLQDFLHEQQVVSVFSRLHPSIPCQPEFLRGLGRCVPAGQTVSIDLTLPLAAQRRQYRRNHHRAVGQIERSGVICIHDTDKVYLQEFIEIYHETMRRVGAADAYFFKPAYFASLVHDPQQLETHLFVCLADGQRPICGGLITVCDGIAQYFLGGTLTEFIKLAPNKLLVDSVRVWAHGQGLHTFHLGGGVSGQEDSLFHFKAGFSSRRHDFFTWQWIVFPEVYQQLCHVKAEWNNRQELQVAASEFFPGYRCPTKGGEPSYSKVVS